MTAVLEVPASSLVAESRTLYEWLAAEPIRPSMVDEDVSYKQAKTNMFYNHEVGSIVFFPSWALINHYGCMAVNQLPMLAKFLGEARNFPGMVDRTSQQTNGPQFSELNLRLFIDHFVSQVQDELEQRVIDARAARTLAEAQTVFAKTMNPCSTGAPILYFNPANGEFIETSVTISQTGNKCVVTVPPVIIEMIKVEAVDSMRRAVQHDIFGVTS